MSHLAKRAIQGWPFVGFMSIVLIVMSISTLAAIGWDVDGVRGVIRATARSSVILFCAAFTASSLDQLRPSPTTRWMVRNRRYLGVSFGVSHTIHYIAVAGFAILDPGSFFSDEGGAGPEKLVPIVMLGLLIATSFDSTAAILGRRTWKWLHWSGSYFFWGSFLSAYGKRAEGSLLYSSLTGFVLMALVLRVSAFAVTARRRRERTA